jgi:hypothetical protein
MKMKKLLSLLGAFGVFVTTSSTIISCGIQQTKKLPDEGQEPNPEAKKINLRAAIAHNNLGLIQMESPPTMEPFVDFDLMLDLTPHILKRLVEVNGQEKITFNPFELAVDEPTLINKFGDMKTTLRVLNRSQTHEGSAEVYFSIQLGNDKLIRQTNLGEFDEAETNQFDFEDDDNFKLKIDILKRAIITVNPHLVEDRFAEQLVIHESTHEWDPTS